MLTVEVCKREKLFIEEDASEVAYDLFRIVCLLQGNLRPQSCYDEVDVFYVYNSIIITANVGTYFKTKTIVKIGNVIVFIEISKNLNIKNEITNDNGIEVRTINVILKFSKNMKIIIITIIVPSLKASITFFIAEEIKLACLNKFVFISIS